MNYDKMKKIVLFSILAFSMNAFAQINLNAPEIRHNETPAPDNNLNSFRNKSLKTTGEYSILKQLQPLKLSPGLESTAYQIIDSAFKWRWNEFDNVWRLNSKIIHVVYDKNNNVTSKTEQGWYHGAWVDSLQYAYFYDTKNYLLGVVMKSWNGNAWENMQQQIQTFDENHNLTSYAMQYWDGTDWNDFRRFTLTYANNRQTSFIYQGTNGVNYSKYTETYDSNNNMISEIFQEWSDILSDWGNYTKSIFTYNPTNNPATKTLQKWNISINDWENSMLHSFEYNAANKKISTTYQDWNYNVWENSGKELYTYDVNYNLTKLLFLSWHGGDWTNFVQYLHTYDDRNNEISELDQSWDGKAWVNKAQGIFTFDEINKQTSELEQDWMGSSWLNSLQSLNAYDEKGFEKSSSYKTWSYSGADVVIMGDSTYNYYHILYTGMPDLAESIFSVYPNPAKGKFSISSIIPISGLEIYNLTGTRIFADFNIRYQTSNEIDLTGFAKGIYILRIHNGTKIYNSKVIVQ